MKKFFVALAALFLCVLPAHAQKTRAQLITELTTNFPDNTVGSITPAILRATDTDYVNSWASLSDHNIFVDDNTATTSMMQIGTGGSNNSLRSAYQVLRNLTGAAELSIHAFADNTAFNFSSSPGGTNGANSFDCRTNHAGNQNYDHFNCYQAIPNFAMTGTMLTHEGFDWAVTISNGTLNNAYGALYHTPSVVGPGTIGTIHAIHIQSMDVGSGGVDRAIFTEGTTASQFGGYVISGTGFIARNATPTFLLQSALAVTIGSLAHDGTNITLSNAIAGGTMILQGKNSVTTAILGTGLIVGTAGTDGGKGSVNMNLNTTSKGATITATAPAAGNGELIFGCGTNAGTAGLYAGAGTSTTYTRVLDNIGAAVTGC